MTGTIGLIVVATALVTIGCAAPGGSSGDVEEDEIVEIVEIVDKKGSGSIGGDTPASVVLDLTFDGILDPDLTVVGATQTVGRSGEGMSFDDYPEYLSIADAPELTLAEEGTLEVWLYADSHVPFAGILHKGNIPDFAQEAWLLQFWGFDGQLALWLHNDAGKLMVVTSSTQLQIGQWHFVVATWDANQVKLFVDGQVDNVAENTIGSVRDTDAPLLIGAALPDGRLGFRGVIDDVRVHSEALGEAEIAERYTDMVP